MKQPNWYSGETGNHQGLVIEETTGRNVAVAYDNKDTPLLAAAPELLEALEAITEDFLNSRNGVFGPSIFKARDAIQRAKG